MASTSRDDPGILLRRCESIALRKEIRAEDVAVLECSCSAGAELAREEADALFALAYAGFPACPEWREFFSETMSGWFVETYARNNVGDDAARRLIAWLGGDEARLDAARFRFLMRVLERASHCPDDLLAFARATLMRAMGVEKPAPRRERLAV